MRAWPISYLLICILGQQARNSWFECWLAEVLDLSISMWSNHLARGFLMQGQVMKWDLTTLNQLWQICNTSGQFMREALSKPLLHYYQWHRNVIRELSCQAILNLAGMKVHWMYFNFTLLKGSVPKYCILQVDLCADIRLEMCCWVACTHSQPEFREDWQALNAAVF